MTRSKWMRIKYIDVGVIYCLALQRLWICSALSSKNKTYISLLYVSYIYIFFYLRLNILTSVVQCIFHVITYLYRFRIYYPLPKKRLYYSLLWVNISRFVVFSYNMVIYYIDFLFEEEEYVKYCMLDISRSL